MQISRGILAIALAVTVATGCTKADTKPDGVNGPEDAEQNNASFQIKSVKGSGTTRTAQDIFDKKDGGKRASHWRIPKEATFSFHACIQDASTRSEAVGHRFQVELPGRNLKIFDVTPTRPGGCFTWMETIPFSFFVKRSRWVVVERDIVGTGIHSGRQRVRLALNPWALGKDARDSGEAVLFLRDDAFPPDKLLEESKAKDAFGGEGLGEDQLFVDEVSVQTIRRGERNSGTLLSMNVSMEPKVRFENAEGIPQFRKLESGDFIVKAHLVLNETGDKLNDRMILTSGVNLEKPAAEGPPSDEIELSGTGRVINGKLIARLNAFVDPRVRQGNLELVVKIIPTVSGLKEFSGTYELGALRNLSANASGSLNETCRNSLGCDTSAYLRSASNFAAVKASSLASEGQPYLFDRLKLRFVQVQPGETTTRRTVAYSASTCVIDAFTGDRVVGLKFKIKYKGSKGAPIEKATAEDGCLNWDATIFHQYYMPEEFIEQSVTITKDTGVARDLKFYINPWDDKFTFGFDEREFTQQFWAKLRERKKIKSRFFMSEFGYHTVRFQYNIDSLMSLEVRKTVLMELQPQVLRYSGIINARKMTEPLRDGIWLLKVGIQKNYLDPAQAGVVIDTLQNNQAQVRMANEPAGAAQIKGHARLRKLGIEATTKEFISTETALVRVTDGVIIQPVELRMQDLRMMRIRKNFLIQLETVDERKLQVDNALHRGVQEELQDLLEKRRQMNEDQKRDGVSDDEKAQIKKEEDRIRERIEGRRQVSRRVFDYINRQLNARGSFDVSGASWDELKLEPEQREYIRKLLGYERRQGEPDDLNSLKKKLDTNDFTDIKLPACSDINCDTFIEQNSGLERRTFVGPVIFLSNAYKDSVRATDNLDEAKCGQKVEVDDPLEDDLRTREREMFLDTDSKVEKDRQNNLYKFSEYFGSLRHLCYSHVDDLIRREKEDRLLYEKSGPAIASIHQFATTYNLDFLSLGDEQPKTVEITPENIKRCNNDLVNCMQPTMERWMKSSEALQRVNRYLGEADVNMWKVRRWFADNPDDIKLQPWNIEDLRRALFENKSPRSSRYAACALTVSNMLDLIQASGQRLPDPVVWRKLAPNLISRCVTSKDALSADRKLRVFKTGQDGDSYIFLGGLQLNLNVGQSFSVGRSDSWSFGIEATDFIAWGGRNPVTALAATAFKPFNLKYGTTMSRSDGTSVADSTYLVAQIARFKVRLDEYEQCMVLKLHPGFLAEEGYLQFTKKHFDAFIKSQGFLVCEGMHRTDPRYVKEDYYYFTQHFTEGDMLDQADLYNHPWLLALRGQRDFGTFLHAVRAQEVLSFKNFAEGAMPGGKLRNIGWPLEQMLGVYKQITPSFPGFYTVLDENEEMTQFPLERRMSKADDDVNFEVISRDRRVQRNSNVPR
jgi:hypothetical protein